MKGSILGLAAAAVVFAGSTLYLYRQVGAERARADEVTELTQRLNARITELERAKAEFAQRRFAMNGAFSGGAMGPGAPGMPPPEARAVLSAEAGDGAKEADENAAVTFRHEPSPAMQKMMKAQMRANTKRMYGDFAEEMGLGREEANKLYDLLTEQQMPNFASPTDDVDPNDAHAMFENRYRQQQSQLADLLGADKAESLQKYQESMPARSEVEMIARQLEGADAALDDDQRKRLVAALTEERSRVPPPDYTVYGEGEAYNKALTDWQKDYDERSTSRARSILDTQQLSAYNEFQQWQSEMRDQFAVMGPTPRRFRAGAVAVGGAIPVGPPMMITNTFVAAPVPPPPVENTKKSK